MQRLTKKNHSNNQIIKSEAQYGKVSLGFILVCLALLFGGMHFAKKFASLDPENERQYNSLKELARQENISVEEYVKREELRSKFANQSHEARNALSAAIKLQDNEKIPVLMKAMTDLVGDNYDRWTQIYSHAIAANNMDAFKWFLKQGYPCDFSVSQLGGTAFRAAIRAEDIRYFELLLKNDCDTRQTGNAATLTQLLQSRNGKYKSWLLMLDRYQYKKLAKPKVKTELLCGFDMNRQYVDEANNKRPLSFSGEQPKIFINREPSIFENVALGSILEFWVYFNAVDKVKAQYSNANNKEIIVKKVDAPDKRMKMNFKVPADFIGPTEVTFFGFDSNEKLITRDSIRFCIPVDDETTKD